MKFIIVTIAMISLVACSSTPETQTKTNKAEVTASPAATTTSTDAPAKKSATKETTTTSSSDAGSGFPSITGTEKSAVTCTNKSDTRKISVLTVTDGGCGVVYNKMGTDKTVALAKSMSYCDSVSSKMKTNLEGAGFNCGGEAASTGTSSDQPQ